MTKQELARLSVRELKDLLSAEGYSPERVTGIEKSELVEKLYYLQLNPVEEDPYPLPLFSNCWPQFILRGLLQFGLQMFVMSYLVSLVWNLALVAGVVMVLAFRN